MLSERCKTKFRFSAENLPVANGFNLVDVTTICVSVKDRIDCFEQFKDLGRLACTKDDQQEKERMSNTAGATQVEKFVCWRFRTSTRM